MPVDERSLQIRPVPPEDWPAALGILFRELPDDVRGRQVEATLEQFRAEPTAAGGLLEARTSNKRVGTTWIQLQAGRVASLWPPQVVNEAATENERIARALIDAASELALRGGSR